MLATHVHVIFGSNAIYHFASTVLTSSWFGASGSPDWFALLRFFLLNLLIVLFVYQIVVPYPRDSDLSLVTKVFISL